MLFVVPGYFVWLAALVAVYWLLCRRAESRLFVLALSGIVTAGYLLYRNLPNTVALPLFAALLGLSVLSYVLARRQLRHRSIGLLRFSLVAPFAIYGVAYGHGAFSDLPSGHALLIPLSIGFFVLRQLHLIYECYRGTVTALSPEAWAAYVFFVPTLIAGPLARYPEIHQQVEAQFSISHISSGFELLLIGAFKKFIVADLLLAPLLPPTAWASDGFPDASWSALAIACATKFLHVYFDFSGYTDMARGTAKLLAIDLPQNFNFPLLKPNLAEFWRSWHMSLASFVRDYVYFPLLVSTRNAALAIVATMLVIGAWHAVQPGWLVWGLHHAAGLIALAAAQRRVARWSVMAAIRRHKLWRLASTAITLCFVSLAYAWTWRPDAPSVGLSIYLRLLSGGLLG